MTKGCCTIARQRAATASERAGRARAAGHPVQAMGTSLEGVLALALAATLWRSAVTWLDGPPPPPVPRAAPTPTPRPRAKPRHTPVPVQPGPGPGWDAPPVPGAGRAAKDARIKQEFGDKDFCRAVADIIRTSGKPRPVWPGRDAWEIVHEGAPEFAIYLESLKVGDPSAWLDLRMDLKKSKNASAQLAWTDGQRRARADAAAQEAAWRAAGHGADGSAPPRFKGTWSLSPEGYQSIRQAMGFEAVSFSMRHGWHRLGQAHVAGRGAPAGDFDPEAEYDETDLPPEGEGGGGGGNLPTPAPAFNVDAI